MSQWHLSVSSVSCEMLREKLVKAKNRTGLVTCWCQGLALTWSARCTSGRHSRGGGQDSPIGKQQHLISLEYTCWRTRQTAGSQQIAEQTCKRHVISHMMVPRPMDCIQVIKISYGVLWHNNIVLHNNDVCCSTWAFCEDSAACSFRCSW